MKVLISVITVVFNDVNSIESTILSIINQSLFDNTELIIIDGGSTDGTVEIIKKYDKYISKWVSQKDNGVYHAMNKGIEMASGIWVNFMNSGDSFHNNYVLEKIGDCDLLKYDILYGSTNCFKRDLNYFSIPLALKEINNKMVFCHQSSFVKRDVLNKYKFDLNYKIASDYNLFYKLFDEGFQFYELNYCLSNYNIELGISTTNYFLLEKERLLINGKWFSLAIRVKVYLNNIKFNLGNLLRKIVK